jgi:hypothetical protein
VRIVIDNKGFTFDECRFIYDLYYVKGEEYDAPTLAGVFKNVLVKWANALQNTRDQSDPLYLPFAPDDQWVDCLMATPSGDRLELKAVKVAQSGYSMNFSDLESFITSPQQVIESHKTIGEFDKDQFISTLINADVVDE